MRPLNSIRSASQRLAQNGHRASVFSGALHGDPNAPVAHLSAHVAGVAKEKPFRPTTFHQGRRITSRIGQST
jgi:hypothetical protein